MPADAPSAAPTPDPERRRLAECQLGVGPWRKWGTVREDYSFNGDAWNYFPFAHAHRRAYRWGEDGLLGISDHEQRLCLAVALWNGKDPILKERLFGLTNGQGNRGEDVKEFYYYLDATPTHSYLKGLYKYPQGEFPYRRLLEENGHRTRTDPEFELLDTGAFAEDRYWDVTVEYAKETAYDILMRVTVTNRGPEEATVHVLPTAWYRNSWSWQPESLKPTAHKESRRVVRLIHPEWDDYRLHFDGDPELLFTENDTNLPGLYGVPAAGPFKDAFHDYLIGGNAAAVGRDNSGTKVAGVYKLTVPAGGSATVRVRLRHLAENPLPDVFAGFDAVFADRVAEADKFYAPVQLGVSDPDARSVQRQAFAGLIWTKQYFGFDIWQWLKGDPGQPTPPPQRRTGRNADWEHLKNADIVSMPDKWEYPWYAAWDLAFHAIPLAVIDPEFAKDQLLLLLREWYMHPNGQLPAYEWNFGDVNPPVHGWACWRVYQIDRRHRHGRGDREFLERCFHKLMLNFTWWVNRKDATGRNVFQGGFLGLDNIGVFDRSQPLPTGGFINQADGTAWMAMYCLNLMRMAMELALQNAAYEDIAIKFFDHFLAIAKAMTNMGGRGIGLWDEDDQFYYDELNLPDGRMIPLRVRSMVGLIPLYAVEVLEPELLSHLPAFARRLRWVLDNRPDLAVLVSRWFEPGRGEQRLLSLLRGHRMKRLLRRMLDETEFLSDYGVRALSKCHEKEPYTFHCDGSSVTVRYIPGESQTGMFGGNSNWRGPIWFPVNYLIIESLQRFHAYYGDAYKVECPTGSGRFLTLAEIADELSARLCKLFLRGPDGRRPVFGSCDKQQTDPHFRDHILFYEYFNGDTGAGLGASHQTGWTALVAKLLGPWRREAGLPTGTAVAVPVAASR